MRQGPHMGCRKFIGTSSRMTKNGVRLLREAHNYDEGVDTTGGMRVPSVHVEIET